MGGGRGGSQPTNDFGGGAGSGGGRPGAQPSLDIRGGAGMGSGRPGSQPSLAPASSYPEIARSYKLQAKVEFGDETRSYNVKSSAATTVYRAHSSINGGANGERAASVADPEGNFIFALEIDGSEVAQFQECSGLKTSTEPFELQEGGMNHRVHKLPGQSRWENLVLRYAVTADTSLLEWRNEILEDGFGKRRNGSIVMKTLDMEEVRRYNFVEGWPVSWEGPSFAANGAEIAVESIEIAHNGIQVT